MTYQIVEVVPTYCPITDGQIGSHIFARSHGYETRALAHKLAAIKWDDNYNHCGDSSFIVVKFGESPFTARIHEQFTNIATDEETFPF